MTQINTSNNHQISSKKRRKRSSSPKRSSVHPSNDITKSSSKSNRSGRVSSPGKIAGATIGTLGATGLASYGITKAVSKVRENRQEAIDSAVSASAEQQLHRMDQNNQAINEKVDANQKEINAKTDKDKQELMSQDRKLSSKIEQSDAERIRQNNVMDSKIDGVDSSLKKESGSLKKLIDGNKNDVSQLNDSMTYAVMQFSSILKDVNINQNSYAKQIKELQSGKASEDTVNNIKESIKQNENLSDAKYQSVVKALDELANVVDSSVTIQAENGLQLKLDRGARDNFVNAVEEIKNQLAQGED